jgi:hypothetical protein
MKKASAGLMVASQVANSKAGQKAIASTTESATKVGKIIGWAFASVLIVGAGLLVYKFLVKPALDKAEQGGEDRANIKEGELVLKEYDKLGLNVDPTKNYKGMADAIQGALNGWSEDEEAVYSQMRLLSNDAEWEALKIAWAGVDGTRPISGGWVGGGNYSLTQALITYLDATERNVVNSIFAGKNMKSRI